MTNLRNSDPLGIGLRSRAAQHRQGMANRGQLPASFGPLSDPMWGAFFQAMDEQGVTRMADNSVGAKRGMWNATPQDATFDPTFQTSAKSIAPEMIDKDGNSLGYRVINRESKSIAAAPDSLTGIYAAAGEPGGWDIERKQSRTGRRPQFAVDNQRGTDGTNQSQRAGRR